MRILFMGTPDFAVPCFDILNKDGEIKTSGIKEERR